jgi:RNA polymerase sigma-70 factor (ECF subfamily)
MDTHERFTRYWTEAQPIVASYLSSLVPDFAATEDLLQEVAVVLLRKFPQYDDSRSFVSWALGVARYEALMLRRTQARSFLCFDPDLVETVADVYVELAPELDERVPALRECLRSVRGRAAELLRLRYEEALSPSEIAERLSTGSVAVRVMLTRVRAALRDCVERRIKREEFA